MTRNIKPTASGQAVPITAIKKSSFDHWLSEQNSYLKNVSAIQKFGKAEGQFLLDHNEDGQLSRIYLVIADDLNPYKICAGIRKLPVAEYQVENDDEKICESILLGWGFGSYEFDTYQSNKSEKPCLIVQDQAKYQSALSRVNATDLVRDLINTPADDMGPTELSLATENLANQFGAEFSSIIGNDLLKQNFPAIHIVGRASHKEPRLLELTWGNANNPTIALVGKGVCFDTGGNNMKSSQFMKWMKKDMGGAAHVLGLAQMIMDHELPVHLKVLIPAVENAVSSNAYRQGDIVKTRSGQTVEIGHTDAEGRVVLSDALSYACEFNPDLVVDYATLTGAARVAMGPNLPPLFANNDAVSAGILDSGISIHDEMWPMPLYKPYVKYVRPQNADLSNTGSIPQAGCITAALFLEHFIDAGVDWVHIDTYGWNFGDRTGGIEGGEALGMAAVFHWIQNKYK